MQEGGNKKQKQQAEQEEEVQEITPVAAAAPIFPIHLLPDTLLPEILNKLDAKEKVLTLPLVCKKWHALSLSEPRLWQNVDLIAWDSEAGCVCWDVPNRVIDRAGTCLRDFHISCLDYDELERLVVRRVGHHLERLSVIHSDMTDEWAIKFAPMLPKLKFLDLSQCFELTDIGINAFCQHCPCLAELHVPLKGVITTYERVDVENGQSVELIHRIYPTEPRESRHIRHRVLHPH